MGPKLVLGGN